MLSPKYYAVGTQPYLMHIEDHMTLEKEAKEDIHIYDDDDDDDDSRS